MAEQFNRDDVDATFKQDCANRLAILNTQRDDLIEELQQLMDDVLAGKRKFKLYRQLKMYNDKKFKD